MGHGTDMEQTWDRHGTDMGQQKWAGNFVSSKIILIRVLLHSHSVLEQFFNYITLLLIITN